MAEDVSVGTRPLRADAAANRERLLDAAGAAVRETGPHVPMTDVADRAGVGVGTLYRHFANRDDLLDALACRALEQVVDRLRAAAQRDGTAIDALRWFLDRTIAEREQLSPLPLHGGAPVRSDEAAGLRRRIRSEIQVLLDRGQRDGTLHRALTPIDVIVAAAQLGQPLAAVPDWDVVARRQAGLILAGFRAGPDAGHA